MGGVEWREERTRKKAIVWECHSTTGLQMFVFALWTTCLWTILLSSNLKWYGLMVKAVEWDTWGLAPFLDNHTVLVGPQGKQENPTALQCLISRVIFLLWHWKLNYFMWCGDKCPLEVCIEICLNTKKYCYFVVINKNLGLLIFFLK